jgi:hypothetical protein
MKHGKLAHTTQNETTSLLQQMQLAQENSIHQQSKPSLAMAWKYIVNFCPSSPGSDSKVKSCISRQ